MRWVLAFGLLMATASPSMAQTMNFGDDSGNYVRDGECDDRRFFGTGMATTLDWEDLGRDATDCRAAYERGQIRLWVFADALAATNCEAIDFGDDGGDYPNDGECDDPRFEGMATDAVMSIDDIGGDAADCSRACDLGLLGLRDYSDVARPARGSGKKSSN